MTDEKDIKLTIEAGEQTEPAVNEVSENQELADESPSLKEVIREQAIEDEAPQSKTFTLRKILGGDILIDRTEIDCRLMPQYLDLNLASILRSQQADVIREELEQILRFG